MFPGLFSLLDRISPDPFAAADARLGRLLARYDVGEDRARLVLDLPHASARTQAAVVATLVEAGLWTVPPWMGRVRRRVSRGRFRSLVELRLRLRPFRRADVVGSVLASLICDETPGGGRWPEHTLAVIEGMVVPEVAAKRAAWMSPGDAMRAVMWHALERAYAAR